MTQQCLESSAYRPYDGRDRVAGTTAPGAHEFLRPLVQVELRRKFTSSECGYLIETAKKMSPGSDRLLQYYVAVRERLLERGGFWGLEAERFLYKINSLTSFELLTLVDAVFRFVDRLEHNEEIYLNDLFDEPVPMARTASTRYYDLDAGVRGATHAH